MIVCPSLNLAESDKDELPLLEGNWKLITEECTKTEETADLVWLFQAMQSNCSRLLENSSLAFK